ncbi:hypothetical protein [uncultured Roseobacter sp.]|uniref:hypothetical protein n=1 Tax=uncultured Roseobacter sp. TaxID=114847 RepID=UPI00260DA723|nr:hypothetical protein [uncultured Roseobacter sp.]
MPDPSNNYWTAEIEQYHGASKRPPPAARQCGSAHRLRYLHHLRDVACHGFGLSNFSSAHERWKAQRRTETRSPKALNWSNQQVRPEMTVIIGLLQHRHLENTGKEISRAEVINALAAAGLPHLLEQTRAFAALPATEHAANNR